MFQNKNLAMCPISSASVRPNSKLTVNTLRLFSWIRYVEMHRNTGHKHLIEAGFMYEKVPSQLPC